MASLYEDAISLLGFKNYISHDPSNLFTDWNPSTNHCKWYSIQCDPLSRRVKYLHITGTNISGILSPSIENLTGLRTLSIPHNVFSGEISIEIGEIMDLETLELQGNKFI
ncbi:hypothetical protein U1Q18_012638 [Sarracenia purpurea var. burkii]